MSVVHCVPSTIWMLCIISFIASSFAQRQTARLLTENEIYKYWVRGKESHLFAIATGLHTEVLTVFTTDLRSSHADGHGARGSAHLYPPNINATINYTNPDIGDGFLSIVYTFEGAINLLPGIPQHVICRALPVLFRFEASSEAKVVTIALTPFQGRPVAYISSAPGIDPADPASYEHVIYSHLNIAVDDATTFYVHTENLHNQPVSRFYITASEYSTSILLQSGVPRHDDIEYSAATAHRFYYFNVTEPHCDLAVMLTVIQGDPDLFASVSDPFPGGGSHDLSSVTSGSDSITVRNATVQMYYVGVQSLSEENVKYSVSALMQCSHRKYFTFLIDGRSQMGLLGSKEWAYYKFEFDYNHSITEVLIQVNPSNGDPDLYVDLDVDIDLSEPSSADPTAWRFQSVQYGSDHLRLSPADYEALCAADPANDTFCTIDVAVFGWTSTVYTLMVSTNNISIALQNGVPNTGYIGYAEAAPTEPSFAYFMFDIESMDSLLRSNNITVSITPLVQTTSDNSIETVFFVDGDLNPLPSAGAHKWRSADPQHPFLIIPGAEILGDDTVNNELYIAVTSNQNLTFLVILTVGTVIQLQDGQYQVGHVRASHSNHYELIIDNEDKSNEDIEVLVNAFHGTVNLYVSSKGVPDPSNAASYDFYNNQSGVSIKRIVINNTRYDLDSDTQCVHDLCSVYITVATPDWNPAEFTIIASTDTAVIPLLDGQPISSQIEGGQYEYFSIDVDYGYKSEPALWIEATPITGDVALYVSDEPTNHRPNATHFTLKSESNGRDAVSLKSAAEGTYYIGVHAVGQRSTFSISATLSNALHPGFVRLLSGVPEQGTISSYHTTGRFYQIYVPEKATLLRVHAEHSLWKIKVFVTRNVSGSRGVPSASNALFHFRSGTLEITNPAEGSWYLGVYSRVLTFYTLTATLSDDLLLLQDGQSITGRLQSKRYDYYRFESHDAAQDFTVSLTCFSGDADLYIAVSNGTGSVRPTASSGHHLWGSMHYGSDLITVSHDDPKSCNASTADCAYILGVYGYSASLYSITASTQSTVTLSDGVPTQGECARNQWKYYRFAVANEPTAFVVSLTVVSGQHDLFLDLGREPTASSWSERRSSWDQDKNIEVHHTSCGGAGDAEPAQPLQSCSYFVGIRGVEEGVFSVSFQTLRPDSQYLLEDGVPATRTVDAEETLYFKYSTMENLKSVTFALTPIAGTPKCYVSSATETPSADDFELRCSSNHSAASSFSIADVSNGTTYHIAVFSADGATFTVSAVGERYERSDDAVGVRLIAGNQQFGSAAADDWAFYTFLPSASETADVIISVYAVSGDPDIFCDTESYPTLSRHRYGADLDGPETLTIPNSNSTYFCGVHADHNVQTAFYIVAYHSHSIVNLIDDVPVIGQFDAANDVNYYHFIAEGGVGGEANGDDVVSIIFSPIYAASPCSILLSEGSDPREATEWDYVLEGTANDGLRGLDLKIKKSELIVADWFITIRPKVPGAAALYTLLLSYDNVSTLQEGLPQHGQSTEQSPVSYYIWNVALSDTERGRPLSIGLSLLSGSCSIYLSRNSQILNSCGQGIGCPLGMFDEERSCSVNAPLVIHPDSPWYIEHGAYFIAVANTEEGPPADSYFTIAAYTASSILFLSNALPTWDYIEAGEHRFYRLYCSDDHVEALDVVLTPNDTQNMGLVLAAVISTARPRPIEPALPEEYETEWVPGHGAVFSIRSDAERFVASHQYFIAVRAEQDPLFLEHGDGDGARRRLGADSMVFTISATATTSDVVEFRALIDGMPQMAIIRGGDAVKYYSFQCEAAQSLLITVAVAEGEVSLWLSNDGRTPSEDHHQWKVLNVLPGSTETLRVSSPSAASFLVAVEARSGSDAVYSIMVAAEVRGSGSGSRRAPHPALYAAIVVVIVVVVSVSAAYGWANWKKNRALEHELEVAELQLNMKGKKSLRQRRAELESTTEGPPAPFARNPIQKKLRRGGGKQKYAELDARDASFTSNLRDPVLVPPNADSDDEYADDDDEAAAVAVAASPSQEPLVKL